MKTITLFVRNFPADLNGTLRVRAAEQNVTLRAFVIKALKEAAKKGSRA